VARPIPPFITRDFAGGDAEALLQLNSTCQPHVVRLDRAELGRLRGLGAVVVVADGDRDRDGGLAGYLIAFADTAPYDGEEFQYFQRHLERPFLYIDQVAVSPRYRQRGVARALYDSLASNPGLAAAVKRCCEVNVDPPNPGSMDFHQRMGFERLAELQVSDGRTVALLVGRIGG
jgi:uncharacterized protein